MQTFLPYTLYPEAAGALDTRRLRKQILEVVQILKALDGGRTWAHHPVTLSWRYNVLSLANYGLWCCDTLRARVRENMYPEQYAYLENTQWATTKDGIEAPVWRQQTLLDSHRGHLYRKDPGYYKAFAEFKDLPLLYPVIREAEDKQYEYAYVARIGQGKDTRFLPTNIRGVPLDGAKQHRRVVQAAEHSSWMRHP